MSIIDGIETRRDSGASSASAASSSSKNSISKTPIFTTETTPLVRGIVEGRNTHDPEADGKSESVSPLGRHVGPLTVVALNFSQMIGTGIFVAPGTILNSVGSIGASLVLWMFGIIVSFCGFSLYTEFASLYPSRSGGEVVYLEKAYPRPKFMVPVTFAICTVLLSYSASNAIVFAQYFMVSLNIKHTDGMEQFVAVATSVAVCIIAIVDTKWSMRLQSVIAYIKVGILIFVATTGLAVISGVTKIEKPLDNFKNPFSGTSTSPNVWAAALVKVIFSFAGWNNANNVLNEIPNPVKTVKIYGSIALALVSVLYMVCAVGYFAAIPKQEIKDSKLLTAALFFTKVYGDESTTRILPSLIAISSFGNLLSVTIGHSRVVREVGRQGVLPYPAFWTNTWPFGTPAGPLLVKLLLTIIVIMVPPPGDAFNFVIDLQSYPSNVFLVLLVIGLFLIRKRRRTQGLPSAPFEAWDCVLYLYLGVSLFLLVAPWIPPPGGKYGGDVSFFYATYCIVGIAILAVCGLYYFWWAVIWPKLGNFKHVEVLERLPDGSVFTRIVRQKNSF